MTSNDIRVQTTVPFQQLPDLKWQGLVPTSESQLLRRELASVHVIWVNDSTNCWSIKGDDFLIKTMVPMVRENSEVVIIYPDVMDTNLPLTLGMVIKHTNHFCHGDEVGCRCIDMAWPHKTHFRKSSGILLPTESFEIGTPLGARWVSSFYKEKHGEEMAPKNQLSSERSHFWWWGQQKISRLAHGVAIQSDSNRRHTYQHSKSHLDSQCDSWISIFIAQALLFYPVVRRELAFGVPIFPTKILY